jgi:FlaG/FlaF family flagellin (archaellin)
MEHPPTKSAVPRNKNGVSTIIGTILIISLAVVGSAVYYVAVTSYMRPQAGLSPLLSITVGASGFTTVSAQIVNTGVMPFTSLSISIVGGSSQLQVAYSSVISGGGGAAMIAVRGLSGGPYYAITQDTTASGDLAATAGSSYAVTIDGTLSNGATYSQAFEVEASP